MKKILPAACCGLLVSAFVLGGLLIARVGDLLENRAEAAMVIARDDFTLLTAKSRNAEEALWVLDNNTGRLLIYTFDGRQVELHVSEDVSQMFGQRSGGNAPGGGR